MQRRKQRKKNAVTSIGSFHLIFLQYRAKKKMFSVFRLHGNHVSQKIIHSHSHEFYLSQISNGVSVEMDSCFILCFFQCIKEIMRFKQHFVSVIHHKSKNKKKSKNASSSCKHFFFVVGVNGSLTFILERCAFYDKHIRIA